MNTSYFSSVLSRHIEENGLSRDNIVDILSKSNHDDVNRCDLTTLSRWLGNKTEPSIYKQFLICIELNIDLLGYIAGINPKQCKESKKDKDNFDGYIRYLFNNNTIFSYFTRKDEVDVYYNVLDVTKHRKLLDGYYSNFSGYMALREKVDKCGLAQPYHVYLFKEGEHVCGHLSLSDNCTDLLKLFGVYDESLKNCIGINPSYYEDDKIFWLVISSLLYFYLSSGNYKLNVYATTSIRDRTTLEFYRAVAGAEVLSYWFPDKPHTELDLGQFFIKFDLLKLLSKPSILSHIKLFIKYNSENILPL